MSTSNIPLVDDNTFQAELAASDVPVLVDFGAEWCAPCRALEPVLETIARVHQGKVRVLRVDADASPALAARFRVRSLPTVVALANGSEHGRHTGLTSADVLLRLLP